MEKYANILKIYFKQSLAKIFIYRTSGLISIIYSLIYLAGSYLSVKVFFSHRQTLAGWGEGEMLVLLGSFQLMTGLFDIFFLWAQDSMPSDINDGKLDIQLLRPANTLFLIATRELYIPGLFTLPVAFYMIIKGALTAGLEPSALQVVLFLVAVPVGSFVMFCITQSILNLSFWIEGYSGIWAFADELIKLGSRPLKMYSPMMRVFLGTLLPVVTAFNLPVNILRGDVALQDVAAVLVLVVVLFGAMAYQFQRGLVRYQSAS